MLIVSPDSDASMPPPNSYTVTFSFSYMEFPTIFPISCKKSLHIFVQKEHETKRWFIDYSAFIHKTQMFGPVKLLRCKLSQVNKQFSKQSHIKHFNFGCKCHFHNCFKPPIWHIKSRTINYSKICHLSVSCPKVLLPVHTNSSFLWLSLIPTRFKELMKQVHSLAQLFISPKSRALNQYESVNLWQTCFCISTRGEMPILDKGVLSFWNGDIHLFNLEREKINRRNLWVLLLGFPIESWTINTFEYIVNCIGNFIRTDSFTLLTS